MSRLLERHIGGPALTVTIADQVLDLELVGAISINHGRRQPVGRPDPSSCTLNVYASAFTTLPDLADTVTINLSLAAQTWLGITATDPAVPRFAGRITDLAHTGGPEPILGIVAVSKRARLAGIGRVETTRRVDSAGNIAADWLTDPILAPLDLDLAAFMDEDPQVTLLDPNGTNPEPQLTTLIDQLELLSISAYSELVELRDGSMTWQTANARTTDITPTVTLTSDEVLVGTQAGKDLSDLVNKTTYTYGAGGPAGQSSFSQNDPASIAKHGLVERTITTILDNATFAIYQSSAYLARHATPPWQLPTLSVELLRVVSDGLPTDVTWFDFPADFTWDDVDPETLWFSREDLWKAKVLLLLRAEFSTLLQVDDATGLPIDDTRLWLEGWNEQITPTSWRMDLAVSDYATTAVTPPP